MRSRFLNAPLLIGLCLSVASAQQAQKPASPPSNPTEEQSSGTQASGMRMHQPSPEMQRLVNALSGTWSITEKYEPGEWMPSGGLGRGEEVWRAGPGGLSLIEDYHSKTPKGEFFGLSVSWWDEKAKGYRAVWCANSLPAGCIVMAKLAKWEGNQLVLGDEFERNGKKFTFKETLSDVTPNSYSQAQYEGESGAELKQLVTIHATRVASPTRANDLIPQLASQAAILKMPGPKVQNLMLGVWSIKIKYEPSPEMPKGDVGEGTEVWRPGPGGLSVIEEEHEKNTHGETDGFSVGWWDAKAEGQRFVWCANDVPEGCVVPKNVAKWEGERLVFIEEREESGRKVRDGEIFSDIDPTSFMQILQKGEAGEGLKTTVTIHATKVNAIDVLHQSTSQASDATKIASMANQTLAQQIDPALQGF